MIVGGEANSYKWYASFIRISDDTIWSLNLSTQNSYTQISNAVTQYNSPKRIDYDFVNEIVYIKSNGGGNGTTVLKLDLTTLSLINMGYSSFADFFLSANYQNQYQFCPNGSLWIGVGDTSLIDSRNYNYKVYQNNGNAWAYRHDINRRICTGDAFGRLQMFDSGGLWKTGFNFGYLTYYGCFDIKGFYRANAAFMTYINAYSIVNWGTSSAKIRVTDLNMSSPNNYIAHLLHSAYTGLFLGFCCDVNRILSTRIIYFKESEANADFGYEDFTQVIRGAAINQLII